MIDAERYRRIDEIFQAALELDPQERAAYISQACDGDESLLYEIENLLSSDGQEWELIRTTAFELVAPLLANKPELAAGDLLGHYNIISLLGAGGMGQVYLARDTRLGRKVALKLLPTAFTRDKSRLHRFQHEARAASALNHPNILTIHELGEVDGRQFIATEYVDGQTLGQRLRSNKPNLIESLDITIQVAVALSAAHQANIIHRDIKPENIMLRHDGYVKVLDFGLAKLTEQQEPVSWAQVDNVNVSSGLVMGTLKYMSPEQALGQPADPRSDIFSLGVLLYELISGRTPFEGKTSEELRAGLLEKEPAPLTDVPDKIQHIISRALHKKKEERYQTVRDLLHDLKLVKEDKAVVAAANMMTETAFSPELSTGDGAITPTSTIEYVVSGLKRHKKKTTLLLVALVVVGLGTRFRLDRHLGLGSETSEGQIEITRVPNTGRSVAVAISPDGRYLAHAITERGKQSIWLIDHSGNNPIQVVPPTDAVYRGLTFSSDGTQLFFVNDSALYKVSVSGGQPQKLLAGVSGGISFSPDGRQFAFVRNINAEESFLMIANADGSGEQNLLTRRKPEFLYSGPAWSSVGDFIACPFGSRAPARGAGVLVIDLATRKEQILTKEKWESMDRLAWLPDGSGLIAPAVESGSVPTQIWFISFPSGEERKITNDLNNYADLYLSADGKSLATISFAERGGIWLAPGGDTSQAKPVTLGEGEEYRALAFTPDDRILYVANTGRRRDIWIMNTDETNRTQLTKNAGNNLQPDASPDGRYIVFSSNRAGNGAFNIWRMNIDGSNPIQLTHGSGEVQPDCSPDGRWVVYSKGGPDTSDESKTLWKVPIDGGEPIPLITTPSGGAAISPDGTVIAAWYMRDNNSAWQIAVIPLQGGPPIRLFDADRHTPFRVRWTPDGQAITYVNTRDGVSNIWSQPLSDGPPRQLTQFTSEQILGFDWSLNGDLVCVRNHKFREIVIMSNFR